MDVKHARDLTPPLRRAGAQNLGEILIRYPVQQVQVVDDARNLVEPIPSPIVAVQAFVTAAAAQRGVLAVRCIAPRGTYILGVAGGAAAATNWFVLGAQPTGLGADIVLTDANSARAGDLNNVNTIAIGDSPDALPVGSPGAPFTLDALSLVMHWFPEPFYVGVGRFFCVVTNVVATNNSLMAAWREVL